mgnify:CR=1 FL=1
MGYDIERFVGRVNEGLLCSICRDVLEDPLQARCEHAFCSSCIYGWLTHYKTCPEDRMALWPSDLKPIFRYMKNDLDKLRIKCDNEPRGCKEVVSLDSLARHVKEECGYIAIACPNFGCSEKMNRCELEAHLLTCDFQSVTCTKGCGLKVCVSELEKHNCVAELRKTLEQQNIVCQKAIDEVRKEFEVRLESHRVHMVYKESALQSQIEDLKIKMAEVLRETRSLKSERSMDRLFDTDSEKRELKDWLRGLKYRDEIAEKFCSDCNKRYLYVRKEPLQSFSERVSKIYIIYFLFVLCFVNDF